MNAIAIRGRSAQVMTAFLEGKSGNTLKAYRRDLEDFALFLGAVSANEAIVSLLEADAVESTATVVQYRTDMIDRQLSPATVNRRLSALRSLVKLARALGIVVYSLEVPGLKIRSYRDTRGPGLQSVKRMVAIAGQRTDLKGRRDMAILRLLFDLGLRREEISTLDLGHVDLDAGLISICGKGHADRIPLSLPEATAAVLKEYIAIRGDKQGPLFVSADRAGKGSGRLTGTAIYNIVRDLGKAAGATARPHGLRHSSITAALDATGGDIRAVQRFSRHADPKTLMRYDDNRKDLGGQVASTVANLLSA